MNVPTARHAQVAADALAAASAADPFLPIFGTSMEEVRAKFAALAEGWDREGWTASTIRLFADFMDSARARADESTWRENDLDVRRAQVGEDLRGMSFEAGSAPSTGETPFELPNPLHDLMWIVLGLAVIAGAVAVLRFKR